MLEVMNMGSKKNFFTSLSLNDNGLFIIETITVYYGVCNVKVKCTTVAQMIGKQK